jgi:hypothetical protein
MLTYCNNFVPLVQLKTINMPRQARKTSGTGIYHVMLRGINRQDIFEDDEDYMKFLQSLHQLVECYDECGYRMRAGFRQLARITGISYGIIQRVVTDQSNRQSRLPKQEPSPDLISLYAATSDKNAQ